MTKLELLEDTVKYYSEDTSRRAVVKGRVTTECMYTTDDGQHCAVGRWLQPNYQNTKWVDNEGCSADDLINGISDNNHQYEVDDLFVEGVRHIPAWFWMDLQQLHDNDVFWDKDGITQAGVEKVDELREDIKVITGE